MPRINMLLFIGVLLLVLMFRSSSALAAAYVSAVAAALWVSSPLGFIVIWKLWKWSFAATALLMTPFMIVDTAFLMATMLKVDDGGWVPMLFGLMMILIVVTWRRGSRILSEKTRKTEVPFDMLLKSLERKPPHVVPGTAVFLTSHPEFAPTALLHNLKHNKVLHEHNVVLTIITTDTPRVRPDERVTMTPISPRFSKISLKFGFMETPNVPQALAIARRQGWSFDIMSTSFFLSRRALKPAAHSGMPLWQDHLFIWLAKSASDATDFFQIPTGRVVEVGTQVTV
jgi:KUP system potassium uptake protein